MVRIIAWGKYMGDIKSVRDGPCIYDGGHDACKGRETPCRDSVRNPCKGSHFEKYYQSTVSSPVVLSRFKPFVSVKRLPVSNDRTAAAAVGGNEAFLFVQKCRRPLLAMPPSLKIQFKLQRIAPVALIYS